MSLIRTFLELKNERDKRLFQVYNQHIIVSGKKMQSKY